MKLALTGGIACGKSSVSKYLAAICNCNVLDADLVCAELLQQGEAGWQGMQNKWSDQFFLENGDVDRVLLRRRIFSDKGIRRQLEQILHPLVRARFQDYAEKNEQGDQVLIFEVPLLFEVGWQNDFDRVVTVYADRCRVIQRICKRDGVTPADAERVVQAQMAIEDKIALSDCIIDNSGFWADTCLQMHHLRHLMLSDT